MLVSKEKKFTDYPDYKDRMRTGLFRGINLGNALDAHNKGECGWHLEEKDFDIIRQTGFDYICIPVRW